MSYSVLVPNTINKCETVLWYAGRARKGGDFGQIRLPENEAAKLMTDHVPASLHFSGVTYNLGSRTILSDVSGSVKPGQVMAIMGASGAGKSTLLDILARKRKRGTVSGTMLVNGREVPDHEFKAVAGFVDQEDTLMSTLTVYETVLYSALLRLPRDMSIEAKQFRTLETLNELGILGIKDSRIGDTGENLFFYVLQRDAYDSCRSSFDIRRREAEGVYCLRACHESLHPIPRRTNER